jgi:hypothetical protein
MTDQNKSQPHLRGSQSNKHGQQSQQPGQGGQQGIRLLTKIAESGVNTEAR